MLKWYRVEIRGRVNGKPRHVQATLQAKDAMWAAYGAVGYEWPDYDIDHGYTRVVRTGKRVMLFMLDAGDHMFITEHESFDEMATEITGAADLAALDGHPTLPLGLETVDGE